MPHLAPSTIALFEDPFDGVRPSKVGCSKRAQQVFELDPTFRQTEVPIAVKGVPDEV